MLRDERPWYLSWKLVVLLILLAGILVYLWFRFFSYGSCDNWDCFNKNLKACDRVKFVGGTDMIFEYTVKGSSDAGCRVDVELLMGELNNQDSIKLEHQKMSCVLPRGVVMIPESNIGRCHGLLKEGLQDLVIKKLHTYLVQNLGKINLEILSVPS
ncbi:MAG: hypothetical protein V1888_03340 [archaeon]